MIFFWRSSHFSSRASPVGLLDQKKMATGHAAYARVDTFDPVNDPRTPWDGIVYSCGEDGARFRSRPHVCKTHGIDLREDCGGCDNYRNKYQENFRGCGARWIGGTTCYYCHRRSPWIMETILPTRAYLERNGFDMSLVPDSVWKAWEERKRRIRAE